MQTTVLTLDWWTATYQRLSSHRADRSTWWLSLMRIEWNCRCDSTNENGRWPMEEQKWWAGCVGRSGRSSRKDPNTKRIQKISFYRGIIQNAPLRNPVSSWNLLQIFFCTSCTCACMWPTSWALSKWRTQVCLFVRLLYGTLSSECLSSMSKWVRIFLVRVGQNGQCGRHFFSFYSRDWHY